MNKTRLEALSDGIFAIVMTLLVIEIRVPELHLPVSNHELFEHTLELWPLFLSYVLSFMVLYSYWRSHHFIVSVFAKNINVTLSSINAVFLMFVALLPFSAHMLGRYGNTQFAIIFYSLNISLIGLTLFLMRYYIFNSKAVENLPFTKRDLLHSNIRVLAPVILGLMAVLISFYSSLAAFLILIFSVVFHWLPFIVDWIEKIFFTNYLKKD